MDIVKGSVVRAKAGRDKDSYFVVLDVLDKFALIADGKSRKLEKPKKKNLNHLEATKTVITQNLETNRKIKKALSDFNNSYEVMVCLNRT